MPENENKQVHVKQIPEQEHDIMDLEIFLSKKKAQTKALKKLFDKISTEHNINSNKQ